MIMNLKLVHGYRYMAMNFNMVHGNEFKIGTWL